MLRARCRSCVPWLPASARPGVYIQSVVPQSRLPTALAASHLCSPAHGRCRRRSNLKCRKHQRSVATAAANPLSPPRAAAVRLTVDAAATAAAAASEAENGRVSQGQSQGASGGGVVVLGRRHSVRAHSPFGLPPQDGGNDRPGKTTATQTRRSGRRVKAHHGRVCYPKRPTQLPPTQAGTLAARHIKSPANDARPRPKETKIKIVGQAGRGGGLAVGPPRQLSHPRFRRPQEAVRQECGGIRDPIRKHGKARTVMVAARHSTDEGRGLSRLWVFRRRLQPRSPTKTP